MRITLVQPPSNRYDTSELAPPLSLLCVASVLEDDDFDVSIVDLNLMGVRDPGFVDSDFYGIALGAITDNAPDVVGFTSMALESHICLELARRLKSGDPGVRIVLGGPHFSAIAETVLRLYPWVDFVVTGEGEMAARGLLRYLSGRASAGSVENVAYLRHAELVLDRRFKPQASLDDLPFPAYHLVDLEEYFRLNPYRVLDIEHARGCALRCAFCYSPVHWGQGEQTHRIDRIVADVQRHYDLGARHLFYVGDNFLNSKTFAREVSDAIAAANPGLTWRCYATLAQLTEEVAESFARSQCKYIFIGVDAVSEQTQGRFLKHYFRGWESLKTTLERCLDRGMTPTCAFMLTPPDRDSVESEAALRAAVHTYNLGAGVRLNPLTVYSETGIDGEPGGHPAAYSSAKARLLLDGHWLTQENDYAREHPELYPFHSTVGPPERYDDFIAATRICFNLLDHFPRTLMQWIHAWDEPLWPVVAQTASRVDHAATEQRHWGAVEAEAFFDTLYAQNLPDGVCDTLLFEITEHRMRRSAGFEQVKVSIDSTTLDFRLHRHALLGLSRPPTDYETPDPPPPVAGPGRTYLLVPSGPAVRYLEPDDETVALIHTLHDAALSGETATAPASRVTDLIAAHVLEPRVPESGALRPEGVTT